MLGLENSFSGGDRQNLLMSLSTVIQRKYFGRVVSKTIFLKKLLSQSCLNHWHSIHGSPHQFYALYWLKSENFQKYDTVLSKRPKWSKNTNIETYVRWCKKLTTNTRAKMRNFHSDSMCNKFVFNTNVPQPPHLQTLVDAVTIMSNLVHTDPRRSLPYESQICPAIVMYEVVFNQSNEHLQSSFSAIL